MKVLLRKGVFQAPQGELRATSARLRRWADQAREMAAAGIRLPVSWGHNPDALPFDTRSPKEAYTPGEQARRAYFLSAYNAGYFSDLSVDGEGQLKSVVDCPGCELDPESGNLVAWTKLPDGREVKCAIGDVSLAIRNWRDGQGKLWEDVPVHLALSPLPVAHGVGGFATTLGTDQDSPTIFLSLAGYVRELSSEEANMADDIIKKKEEEETIPEKKPEEIAPATSPTTLPEPKPGDDVDDAARIPECLRTLEAHGLYLPPGTTPATLIRDICVAGHAKAKGIGKEDEEEDEEEEDEEDKPPAEYPNQTTEEPRPVMMSLATAKTPGEKKLLVREQERHKKKQLRLIDKLVKKGMPPHKASEFRKRYENGYTLSLTEDGEVHPRRIDRELSTWSEALAGSKFNEVVLGEARPEPRPHGRSEDENRAAQEEAGDRLAELAGAPARKK